jgi:hypothetical protein
MSMNRSYYTTNILSKVFILAKIFILVKLNILAKLFFFANLFILALSSMHVERGPGTLRQFFV